MVDQNRKHSKNTIQRGRACLYCFWGLILICSVAHAAPPTRSHTYTSGEIINSSHVTANEDSIFNYLQVGVDTYADGTILNADLSGSANVQCSKLNLTACSQDISNTGSITATTSVTATGLIATTSIQLPIYASDPCASQNPGAIFYNQVDGRICFCDGNGDDLQTDNSTACF